MGATVGRGWQGVAEALDAQTMVRLLLAIALSFGLWIYVTIRNNPIVTTQLREQVLQARTLPDGLLLMTDLPRVDIMVEGPSGIIERLPARLTPYVDFTGAAPGRSQRFGVRVDDVPPGADVTAINPAEVVVDLQQRVSQEFPVELAVNTSIPPGVRMTQPAVQPSAVTVTGAEATVASIARVIVRPEFGTTDTELTQFLRPIPVDQFGREVAGRYLAIDPPAVTVTLPARTVTGTKSVPVRAIIEGQPAPGFQIASMKTTPAVVTVEGDAQTLEGLTAIETERIDITNRQQALVQRVELRVPQGVVASTREAQVEIGIVPVQARLQLELVVTPRGLAPNLTWQATPPSVEVILEGPAQRMQQLDVGALRAEINLQRLGPGTHQVQPEIVGPSLESIRVARVQPATVSVVIRPEPTATPTSVPPTPTATPTGP